jgi:hypothetical protein
MSIYDFLKVNEHYLHRMTWYTGMCGIAAMGLLLLLGIMRQSKYAQRNTDPRKNLFNINKAKLIKITCLGYLQSKSASPRLLGPVDVGLFAPCILNGEEHALPVLDSTSGSSL